MQNKEKQIEEKETNQPIVVFGISVLSNGQVIVVENGEIVLGATEVEFHAKANEVPEYSIKKRIVPKKED